MAGSAPRYPVLAEPVCAETEVSGSRFIADLGPVDSETGAQDFIKNVRAEFPDATHHCWAYLIGEPGSSSHVGFSDDGEPHNTAGRPMLNVLSHCGLGDVVAVVTRYFGGTKLGRGGLVRAYGGAVQQALQNAPTEEKIDWVRFELSLDYALAPIAERLYPDFEVEVLEQDYGAEVCQVIRVPASQVEALRRALADASRGALRLTESED